MKPSYAYDPEHHEPGTPAAAGRCSYHAAAGRDADVCTGEAVVSFQDQQGRWQAGCSAALEHLVASGEIQPFGQGA